MCDTWAAATPRSGCAMATTGGGGQRTAARPDTKATDEPTRGTMAWTQYMAWMEAHHEINTRAPLGFRQEQEKKKTRPGTGARGRRGDGSTRRHARSVASSPSHHEAQILDSFEVRSQDRCRRSLIRGLIFSFPSPGERAAGRGAFGHRRGGSSLFSFPNGALAGIDCSSHGDDDGGRWRCLDGP
jgi:hypothetical protein